MPACSVTLDPTVVVEDDAGTPEADVLESCPAFQDGPTEYLVCPRTLPHAAAAHDCALRRAELASVASEAENQAIAGYAAETVGTNVWLGGVRDDELVWRWANGDVFWEGGSDGASQQEAFVNWAPGEPNDSSTVVADPEKCLALTLGGSDWNDRACSVSLGYVCERVLD
ncbi:MAG TPA: C-type lectin domain-containing protein [Polyangiaceae bacterium]